LYNTVQKSATNEYHRSMHR